MPPFGGFVRAIGIVLGGVALLLESVYASMTGRRYYCYVKQKLMQKKAAGAQRVLLRQRQRRRSAAALPPMPIDNGVDDDLDDGEVIFTCL